MCVYILLHSHKHSYTHTYIPLYMPSEVNRDAEETSVVLKVERRKQSEKLIKYFKHKVYKKNYKQVLLYFSVAQLKARVSVFNTYNGTVIFLLCINALGLRIIICFHLCLYMHVLYICCMFLRSSITHCTLVIRE